jgi:adenylosuccinate lyase
MKKNLDKLGGLVHSQRVLLALTQKGVSREDAYLYVQRNAMPVWRRASEGSPSQGNNLEGEFRALLGQDPDVSAKLSPAELDELFDLSYHFKHVDTIFRRVFGEA